MSMNSQQIVGQSCRAGCCGPLHQTSRPCQHNQRVKRIRRRRERRMKRLAIQDSQA